jgi:hypothetical protein
MKTRTFIRCVCTSSGKKDTVGKVWHLDTGRKNYYIPVTDCGVILCPTDIRKTGTRCPGILCKNCAKAK